MADHACAVLIANAHRGDASALDLANRLAARRAKELILVTAFLVLALTDHAHVRWHVRVRWWPDWQDIRAWRLVFMLGGVSSTCFGVTPT